MVEELAEERRTGRVRGVVRIVRAQRQVHDQLPRPCRQRVVRIEKPTRLAELDQRSLDPSALPGERRQAEDPPELIRAARGALTPVCRTRRGSQARRIECNGAHTGAADRRRLSLRWAPSLFMLRPL